MTLETLLDVVNVLKLAWADLLIPLAVFGLVYAAVAAGLANTPDRKRLAGAIAAVALASLRTVLLHVFGPIGLEEAVQIAVLAGFSWLLAALGYEAKQTIQQGVAARSVPGAK